MCPSTSAKGREGGRELDRERKQGGAPWYPPPVVFAEKMGSTSACGGLAFIRDDVVRIDELGAPQGNGFRSSLVSLMVVNPQKNSIELTLSKPKQANLPKTPQNTSKQQRRVRKTLLPAHKHHPANRQMDGANHAIRMDIAFLLHPNKK